jgi:hypothetical protein
LHHQQTRSIIHWIIAIHRAALKLAHRYSGIAQRHSIPAVKNEIGIAKAIKSVKKRRSLGGVLAFDCWSRALREIALAISILFAHATHNLAQPCTAWFPLAMKKV